MKCFNGITNCHGQISETLAASSPLRSTYHWKIFFGVGNLHWLVRECIPYIQFHTLCPRSQRYWSWWRSSHFPVSKASSIWMALSGSSCGNWNTGFAFGHFYYPLFTPRMWNAFEYFLWSEQFVGMWCPKTSLYPRVRSGSNWTDLFHSARSPLTSGHGPSLGQSDHSPLSSSISGPSFDRLSIVSKGNRSDTCSPTNSWTYWKNVN